MSKRVANTRSRTARNGRVRIGWRKRRMLSILEKQEEQLALGKLVGEAKVALAAFRKKVASIVPKRFLPRTQGR